MNIKSEFFKRVVCCGDWSAKEWVMREAFNFDKCEPKVSRELNLHEKILQIHEISDIYFKYETITEIKYEADYLISCPV